MCVWEEAHISLKQIQTIDNDLLPWVKPQTFWPEPTLVISTQTHYPSQSPMPFCEIVKIAHINQLQPESSVFLTPIQPTHPKTPKMTSEQVRLGNRPAASVFPVQCSVIKNLAGSTTTLKRGITFTFSLTTNALTGRQWQAQRERPEWEWACLK